MKQAIHEINYQFIFKGKEKNLSYTVQVDANPKAIASEKPAQCPDWTLLEFKQCPECPLKPKSHPVCPAAYAIKDIVNDCKTLLSFQEVELKVNFANRSIECKTQVQDALSSLLGLVLANSACPRFEFFRPMAYFHLPLATAEETMFRVLSSYLLAAYFQGKVSSGVDLDPLYAIYHQLQTVNTHLAKRIESLSEGDATQNAVVLLHLLSCILPETLDHTLHDLRPLFKTLSLKP